VAGRLDRIVRGDPPVARPVDWFMRYGLGASVALGGAALVGLRTSDLFAGLLVPAGGLLASVGWLTFNNYAAARHFAVARSNNSRWPAALRTGGWTRFTSALMMAVGALWALAGVAVMLLSEL
jgi:hypothetical protein